MQNGQEYNPYKIFVGIFIPNLIIQDQNLSPGAKIAFGMLCQFAGKDGKCYPGQDKISEKMGVSSRQVINYLNELKEERYIKTSRKGMGKSNSYVFLWKKTWKDPSLIKVNDRSHQEVKDPSHIIGLNRSIVNRNPSVSPLKGGTTQKVNIQREGKTILEEEEIIRESSSEGEKILEEIWGEWESVAQPKFLKEEIGKEEEELNFEEQCRLDAARLNYLKEKSKEIRSGLCQEA